MFIYLCLLLFAIAGIYIYEWKCIPLSIYILCTYLLYPPKYILNPLNILMAYYVLYVVLGSTLNYILDYINWSYVLPWGQIVFWNEISMYTYYQILFTYTVLYLSIYCLTRVGQIDVYIKWFTVRKQNLKLLYITVILLVFSFLQVTGGINSWVQNYSTTYLVNRAGHGLLNITVIFFGNILVYLLGLKYYRLNRKKLMFFIYSLVPILLLSYVNGMKSRLIVLLIIYFSPYLIRFTINTKRALLLGVSFMALLYAGTLIRTNGFYAEGSFFLEMMVGYFNTYQLHDLVVTSRAPDLFSTTYQVFIKPLQILNLVSNDYDFDISIMLTKEFYPEQWYVEKSTQQWPLETELYLNYYGFAFSAIPLVIYSMYISLLYKLAVLHKNIYIIPIYLIEFLRMFSMMRGTMIPWDFPILMIQYLLIYMMMKFSVRPNNILCNVLWSSYYYKRC